MLNLFFKKLMFGPKIRLDVYEKIHALFEDGFTEIKVIEMLYNNAYEAKNSLMVSIYNSMLLNIRSGHKTAAESLAEFVPPLEKLALMSGSSSNPKLAIENALYVLNAVSKVKGEVKSKLTYPFILITVLFFFLAYVGDNLIPMMMDMMPLSKWSPSAKELYDITTWFSANIYYAYGTAIILALAFAQVFPRFKGVARIYFDKYFPGFSIYQDYTSAIFMTALSSQLKSGKSMKQSLEIIERTSPPYLQWHISRMLMNIRAAYKDAEAMDTGLFKRETMADIKAYGQSSSFKEAINKLSARLIASAIKKVGSFSGTLNAVSIMATAGTILWVYSTVMDLSSSMTGGR